jgi:phosphoribosylglycinamide formyltransferase 1
MKKPRIAIFASGSGTNAQNIIEYFENTKSAEICCILCNKPDAYVVKRAENKKLDFLVFKRPDFQNPGLVLEYLRTKKVDFIVLSGFLCLIPEYLISEYPQKIINIHPALLPKYGGKGMYGMNVHNAVFNNAEKETGITIHYVSKNYDEGEIIFQAKTNVCSEDSPDIIAEKVHKLEYEHFPRIIEKLVLSL